MAEMNTRRELFGMAALGAAGLAAGPLMGATAAGGLDRSGRVKFCVIADIHYHPHTFPHSTKDFLGKVIARAKREKCDFIISLGDFNHHAAKDTDYNAYFRDCGLPTYHVIGNHDDDGNPHEETLAAYGLKSGHYFFDRNGFRFIVMDPNHVRWADGTLDHYSSGNYYKKDHREDLKAYYDQKKRDVIGVVPPEQVEWLRETLAASPYPCVIASHQSFERDYSRCSACSNGEEIRKVFAEAVAACPGKIALVMNGHHHIDYFRVLDGIRYFDVNSASFQWMGSNYKHGHYSAEYCKEVSCAPFIVGWDDPLSAIVTMSGDGHLKIDGSDALYTHGVTAEMCKFGPDGAGRRTHPSILSIEL